MRSLSIPLVLFVTALAAAGVAHGELAQSGQLRIVFDGEISPRVLPRDRLAPVTARVEGSIGMADGSRPPQLRRLSIAFNRSGRVSSLGLPTCHTAEIEQTDSEAALSLCGDALVGHGHFASIVHFPGSGPIPAEGRALAFNSRRRGRPALLLHIHGANPIQFTFIVPFTIVRQRRGDFGTVLSARIPRLASDFGYVTEIKLTIGRRYRYRGHPRSFLSASCAAPSGFPGGIFDLARGSFSFASGQQLTTTLVRNCKVR
jgi:hypothetical protein